MKDENQIDDVSETQSTEPKRESVGQILSSARNEQGFSLEELSEQIRVPLKVLIAIEADELPGNLPETFVRGYIRSYAKKVGVEESKVLIEIETTAPSSADAMAMQSFSKRSKRKKIERRLTIISWIIFIILGSAFVFWWYQTKGIEMLKPVENSTEVSVNEAATETTPSSDTSSTERETVLSKEMTDENLGEQAPENEELLESQKSFPASTLKVQKNDVAETTTDNKAVEKATEQQDLAVTPAASESNAVDASNDNQNDTQVTPVQSPIVLSEAEKRLLAENGEVDENDFIKVEFKFEQEVWVEVYDAYDERIAVGNKPAGYLMKLNAQGPFRVLLGSTYGVTIWVNDKEYDISEYPTNRVARFDIDTQQ